MARKWTKDELAAMAEAEARKAGFPAGLGSALIEQESGFDVNAKGRPNRKGERAEGVMQIWSTNSKKDKIDPYDPVQAIPYGIKLLSDYKRQFGGSDVDALTAYNWGPGNLRKYITGERKDIPKEAQLYAGGVLNRMPKYGGTVERGQAQAAIAKFGGDPAKLKNYTAPARMSGGITSVRGLDDSSDTTDEDMSMESAISKLRMESEPSESAAVQAAFGDQQEQGDEQDSILLSLIKREVEAA